MFIVLNSHGVAHVELDKKKREWKSCGDEKSREAITGERERERGWY